MKQAKTSIRAALAGVIAVAAAAASSAQLRDPGPAIGLDTLFSTDADGTEVFRLGGSALFGYRGPDDYVGLRGEQAWFNTFDGSEFEQQRLYLTAARTFGDWLASGRIGTDFDNVIGQVNVRRADWSTEVFLERGIVETPVGLRDGLYYTFLGASVDLAIDDESIFTVMGGVQEFTGDNVRLHARANVVHSFGDSGISAQLRSRYYHSTVPGEFDYFSPENYAEIIPVLQLRRFDGGWEYLIAGGYGARYDSFNGWDGAGYVNARIRSPRVADSLLFQAEALYTSNPVATGTDYDYLLVTLGIVQPF